MGQLSECCDHSEAEHRNLGVVRTQMLMVDKYPAKVSTSGTTSTAVMQALRQTARPSQFANAWGADLSLVRPFWAYLSVGDRTMQH